MIFENKSVLALALLALAFQTGAERSTSSSNPEALVASVQQENLSKVKSLLASRVDVNVKNEEGKSPLIIAATQKNSHILEALLRSGAKIDVRDKESMTPLHYAASTGATENLQKLLEKGANPNIADRHGRTPLYFAHLRKDKKALALLEAASSGYMNQ